ncbi:MAG: hypothetical protein ACD_75C02108G0001 [uncultured bacterium]|nr:MAG: hypothetical protein ACD_75C02108G0001 [uncultured bacterium]
MQVVCGHIGERSHEHCFQLRIESIRQYLPAQHRAVHAVHKLIDEG